MNKHEIENVVKTIGGSTILEAATLQRQKTTVGGPSFSSSQSKKTQK